MSLIEVVAETVGVGIIVVLLVMLTLVLGCVAAIFFKPVDRWISDSPKRALFIGMAVWWVIFIVGACIRGLLGL